MTAGKKYTLFTLLFYIIFLSLTPVAEHFLPSGPCVPGGGIYVPINDGQKRASYICPLLLLA